MAKFLIFHRFWVTVTAVLSAVFAILFFPIALEKYGFPGAALLTLVGLLVIWTSYFIRAYIFTRR